MIIADTLINDLTPSNKPRYIDNVERSCNHIIYSITKALVETISKYDGRIYLLMSGGIQSSLLAAIMSEAEIDFTPIIVSSSQTAFRDEKYKKVQNLSKKYNFKNITDIKIDYKDISDIFNTLCNDNSRKRQERYSINTAKSATIWGVSNIIGKENKEKEKPLIISGGFLEDIMGYSSYSSFDKIKSAGMKEADIYIDKKISLKTMKNNASLLSAIDKITPDVNIFFPFVNLSVYKSICDIYLGTLFSPSLYKNILYEKTQSQLALFDIVKEDNDSHKKPGMMLDLAFYMGIDENMMFLNKIKPEESIDINNIILDHYKRRFPRTYSIEDMCVELAIKNDF